MKQYEVVVRYENSRSDTFIAKDPPDTPDAILTNQSELVPFPYTAPSGQDLVCYVRANKVASVIVREIEAPDF
jgi:hypothetical protein